VIAEARGKAIVFILHLSKDFTEYKGLLFLVRLCIVEIKKGEKMAFRERREGFRRGGFDRGPREMHKATCADCGQECEVPFKPTEGRPVYCKECYPKHKQY
jgi:CxxC-x17-CxxC domain-containing protein